MMELNEEQRQAVESREHCVVIAGPGTGKTATLVGKVKKLLEAGVPPEKMLVLTFSRKAADEMRERIFGSRVHEIGKSEGQAEIQKYEKKLFVGTLHAWGLKMLKEHTEKWENRRILSQDEQLEIIKSIARKKDFKFTQDTLTALGKLRAQSVAPSDADLSWLLQEYRDYLEREMVGDFDQILEDAQALLKKGYPQELKTLEWLLVDEVQDLNTCQLNIVRHLLKGSGAYIFAVGDPDQGIYGFRGADAKGLFELQDELSVEPLYLTKNYRSDQKILDASVRVFTSRKVTLQSYAGKKNANVGRLNTDSDKTEAYWVARMIESLTGCSDKSTTISHHITNDPIGFDDIAICYRSYQFSTLLAKEFSRSSIPFTVIGEKKLGEYEDVLWILRIILAVIEKKIPYNWPQKIQALVQRLESLAAEASLRTWLSELYQSTSRQNVCTFSQVRWQKIYGISYQFPEFSSSTLLPDFYAQLVLACEDEELEKIADTVTMISLHAAKGLEFDCVFLVGLEEGSLPYSKAHSEEEIEEERRLLYVGMTRAKRLLYLTVVRQRMVFGKTEVVRPSRFLAPISEYPLLQLIEDPYLEKYHVQKKKLKEKKRQMGLF